MNVLVTGGAGYVGSVVAAELAAAGSTPVVIDDLSAGHRGAVPRGVPLVEGNAGDRDLVEKILRDHRIEAIVHMAASCLVGESVADPERYFRNNVIAGIRLLEAARASGVERIVFSSSAATYGEPEKTPIEENAPTRPVNPYGETKVIFERVLHWSSLAYGTRYASLRYFNAAGAWKGLGEDHDPETHLIPAVVKVALGQRQKVEIYGDDYPTPDGTCVRDFVHVADLARAHVLALAALDKTSRTYNLGGGRGSSVLEVIRTARQVTGHRVPAVTRARRPGDAAVLVASCERIGKELGWRPTGSDLPSIIESAWAWHQANPEGYGDD